MTESKVANRPNSHQRNRINANSFATNIAPMEPMENNGEWRNASQGHDSAVELGCACCTQGHSLQQCQQFKQMKHRDKLSFLKEKELCFGCLCAGHWSRNCEGRLTCKTCGQRHPTVLHIDRRETASAPTEPAKESGAQVITTSPKTCDQIRGRKGSLPASHPASPSQVH